LIIIVAAAAAAVTDLSPSLMSAGVLHVQRRQVSLVQSQLQYIQ